MTEAWTQCRARSDQGTYCILNEGHMEHAEIQHEDKWDYRWPQEVSDADRG